jgi:protein ImuA
MISHPKADVFAALQSDILRLEGFKSVNSGSLDSGLGVIKNAFPNASFPLGCLHEFMSSQPEDSAATNGFIAGLLASLMGNYGTLLWIGSSRKLFPPALKAFGLTPEHFIFIDVQKQKDVLWVMDEALKCPALSAVVGELKDISFTESRRLQLAAEHSQVTGFVLRHTSRTPNTTACVSRWKITSMISEPIDDLPGIGYPKWRVELLRVRNGKPDSWDIQWMNGKFVPVYQTPHLFKEQKQKAG